MACFAVGEILPTKAAFTVLMYTYLPLPSRVVSNSGAGSQRVPVRRPVLALPACPPYTASLCLLLTLAKTVLRPLIETLLPLCVLRNLGRARRRKRFGNSPVVRVPRVPWQSYWGGSNLGGFLTLARASLTACRPSSPIHFSSISPARTPPSQGTLDLRAKSPEHRGASCQSVRPPPPACGR